MLRHTLLVLGLMLPTAALAETPVVMIGSGSLRGIADRERRGESFAAFPMPRRRSRPAALASHPSRRPGSRTTSVTRDQVRPGLPAIAELPGDDGRSCRRQQRGLPDAECLETGRRESGRAKLHRSWSGFAMVADFFTGSGSEQQFNAARLMWPVASSICVTINYRLGRLRLLCPAPRAGGRKPVQNHTAITG